MLSITREITSVPIHNSINATQVTLLVLASVLVTIGLAMFLSDVSSLFDVLQSSVVVFGGAVAGLLLSFSMRQIAQALQLAVVRAIHGGSSPRQMIRAMLNVCEVSRRDGLLGVAEIRSNSFEVEEVCELVGDASDDESIRFALERRIAGERLNHQMAFDVFVFTGIYALLFGLFGALMRFANTSSDAISGSTFLPLICGGALSVIMTVFIARLRSAHMRELIATEIAYRAACIMLEDNNLQRLNARLNKLVPAGLKS